MKSNYVINWSIRGATVVRADDEYKAQHAFDKMDVHRLFHPRATSPYGHPDSVWAFDQNANPVAQEGPLDPPKPDNAVAKRIIDEELTLLLAQGPDGFEKREAQAMMLRKLLSRLDSGV